MSNLQCHGQLYDGRSSAKRPAQLHLLGDQACLRVDDHAVGQCTLEQLEISSRLGDTPRRLHFADGQVFITSDNACIDQWLRQQRPQKPSSLLHSLERHKTTIVLGLLILIGTMIFATRYGIPTASRWLAHQVPVSWAQTVGQGALSALDLAYFEPSQLSEEQQQPLRQRFSQLQAAYPDYEFALHFRQWDDIPNAFALPSGDVVVTDTLVELASENEVVAVMAHEIGHVVERHSLRSLIQSSLIASAIFLAVGDVSSLSGLITALPTLLVEANYSRQHETEADNFAYHLMQQQGLPHYHFADALLKLERYGNSDEAQERPAELLDYLSSHPATADRIRRFQQAPAE